MAFICLQSYQRLCPIPSEDSSPTEVANWLDMFYRYSLSVRALAKLDSGMCRNCHVQRVFSFRPVSSESYQLLRGGFASTLVAKQTHTNPDSPLLPQIMHSSSLSSILEQYLANTVQKCTDAIVQCCEKLIVRTIARKPSNEHQQAVLVVILRMIVIQDMLHGPALEHSVKRQVIYLPAKCISKKSPI